MPNQGIEQPSAHAEKIKTEKGFFTRLEEWNEIEDLVVKYKRQFDADCTPAEKKQAQQAITELLENFNPLFKKYLLLIKSSQIDFADKEMKRFVLGFIGDPELKAALKRDRQSKDFKHQIMSRFNFVKETYGALSEEVIMIDLQMLMLILAKRYKQMGRNFCAYVYNAYSFEVSRHIKKFIKNPSNICYKKCEYEDLMQTCTEKFIEDDLIDRAYENNVGIPDSSWINGTNCSDTFSDLTPIERKILIKYYLEDYNDRQIGEALGLHINTINQKRRQAVSKLARLLDVDESTIKRSRNSGKKILMGLN